MRPLINSCVGTNPGNDPPQYRFSNDGNFVEVAGHIKNPTSGNWTSISFCVLPAAYRPNNTNGERWACSGVNGIDGSGFGYSPLVQAYGNGNMTIELANVNIPANSIIGINGRFAVSGPAGFIAS
jgi:hypothetical protein